MADKDNRDKILQYESNFKYADGLIKTPKKWISYFWSSYYKKVAPIISSKIGRCEKVVFIGIGEGDVIPMLSDEERKKVIGIDINASSLLSAEKYVKAILADAADMPFESNSVDLIVCNQVLHHIIGQGTLETTLRECYRILRKEGEFIVIEPNSFHPSGMLINIANRFHKYHLLTGGSDHEFSISPLHLMRLLRKCNFTRLKGSALTFSHYRFSIFLQRAINLIDDRLSRFYLLGLINTYTAVK